jgi:hypothetical protein
MIVDLRSVDHVPVVVEAGLSLSDIAPVDAPEGVDAAWTAMTKDGFPADVLFREERYLFPPAMEPDPAPEPETEADG